MTALMRLSFHPFFSPFSLGFILLAPACAQLTTSFYFILFFYISVALYNRLRFTYYCISPVMVGGPVASLMEALVSSISIFSKVSKVTLGVGTQTGRPGKYEHGIVWDIFMSQA